MNDNTGSRTPRARSKIKRYLVALTIAAVASVVGVRIVDRMRLADELADFKALPKAGADDLEADRVKNRAQHEVFLVKWPQGAQAETVRQMMAGNDAVWAQADFAKLDEGTPGDSAENRERKRADYAGFVKTWPAAAQVAGVAEMLKRAEETWRLADELADFKALPKAGADDLEADRVKNRAQHEVFLVKWPQGAQAETVRLMMAGNDAVWTQADFAKLDEGTPGDSAEVRERKRATYDGFVKTWPAAVQVAGVAEMLTKAEETWRLADELADVKALPKAGADDLEADRVKNRAQHEAFLVKWPQGAQAGTVRQMMAGNDAVWAQADFAKLDEGTPGDSAENRERKRAAYAGFVKTWPTAAQVAGVAEIRKRAEETWHKTDFGSLVEMKPDDSLETIKVLRRQYLTYLDAWPNRTNSVRVTGWLQAVDKKMQALLLLQGDESYAKLQPVKENDASRERGRKLEAFEAFLLNYTNSPHRLEVTRLLESGGLLHKDILESDKFMQEADEAIRQSGQQHDLRVRLVILDNFLSSIPADLSPRARPSMDKVREYRDAARKEFDDSLWNDVSETIKQAPQDYEKTIVLIDDFFKEKPENHTEEAQSRLDMAKLDVADHKRWQDVLAGIETLGQKYSAIISRLDEYLGAEPRQNKDAATTRRATTVATWDKHDYEALWEQWRKATENSDLSQQIMDEIRDKMTAYMQNDNFASSRRDSVRKCIEWFGRIAKNVPVTVSIERLSVWRESIFADVIGNWVFSIRLNNAEIIEKRAKKIQGIGHSDIEINQTRRVHFKGDQPQTFCVVSKYGPMWGFKDLKAEGQLTPMSRIVNLYYEDLVKIIYVGSIYVRVADQPELPAYSNGR
jgi:hypothetical protein